MPNPDFTGTVPRMRCETCKYWERHSGSNVRIGRCLISARLVEAVCIVLDTTDLTVCSNWERNPSSAE